MKKKKYRTLFISDIHLGRKFSKPQKVLELFKKYDFEYIFLVGDIIDIWAMKKKVYWREEDSKIVSLLMKKARKDTKVYYIPGNHDDEFRIFDGVNFGGIQILNETYHTLDDNRKVKILHGDKFDGALKNLTILYHIGDFGYQVALYINSIIDPFLKKVNKGWSASKALKYSIKNVVKYINNYKKLIQTEIENENVDGVICGHVHQPELIECPQIYGNCGCWIENCTCIIENYGGKLELIKII